MTQLTIKRLFTAALVIFWMAASIAHAGEGKTVVSVMTRNMDAGTDLNLLFEAYPNVPAGVSATIAEVIATDIPGRAVRLADEIRTTHPDFIALQEVTEWRAGACGSTARLYDQLQLLLDALAARNMRYETLAVDTLFSVELPALEGCVRMTDRNAVLVAKDLRPMGVEISNVQSGHYTHALDLSPLGFTGFPVTYFGYISADVSTGSETFRLFDTHLASVYPRFDPTGLLQAAQALELVQVLAETTLPVVLCGDLNSNAEVGPEQSASYGLIIAAGLTDVWREFNPPGTGYTWPLYNEDPLSGPAVSNERIDLIFTRGIRALKVDETGLKAPYASDHAGVVAMLQTGK